MGYTSLLGISFLLLMKNSDSACCLSSFSAAVHSSNTNTMQGKKGTQRVNEKHTTSSFQIVLAVINWYARRLMMTIRMIHLYTHIFWQKNYAKCHRLGLVLTNFTYTTVLALDLTLTALFWLTHVIAQKEKKLLQENQEDLTSFCCCCCCYCYCKQSMVYHHSVGLLSKHMILLQHLA